MLTNSLGGEIADRSPAEIAIRIPRNEVCQKRRKVSGDELTGRLGTVDDVEQGVRLLARPPHVVYAGRVPLRIITA